MDNLLIKYILEETTPEESGQVQQWLAADAANRAHFEKLQAAWQLAAQPNRQLATDTPQALQRLKQTLQTRETTPVKRIWPRVWTAAAAVVGIVGVALGAYVWIIPKAPVKEQPPVVQPNIVRKKPVRIDTVPSVPAVQPVPALQPDTMPLSRPLHKIRPAQVRPVQPARPKKKAAVPRQPPDTLRLKKKPAVPGQPADTLRPKKKLAMPAQRAQPPVKRKSATPPWTSVNEPPIS